MECKTSLQMLYTPPLKTNKPFKTFLHTEDVHANYTKSLEAPPHTQPHGSYCLFSVTSKLKFKELSGVFGARDPRSL